MAGRVTKDPESGVATIELDTTSGQDFDEQLAEPEAVAALDGETGEGMAQVADILPGVVDGLPEAPSEATESDDTSDAVDEEKQAFLPRYQRPSDAAKAHVLKRIMEGALEIDGVIVDDQGSHWKGVRVVPVSHIVAVAVEALPEPNAFNSEVQSGGSVTVWTKCSDCGGLYPDQGTFGSEYKSVEMNGVPKRTLKSKWKSEGMSHVCGQGVLPLGEPPVPGQTEAFAEPEPAPERTTPIPVVPLEDVLKLLHRLEREELLDDDRVGIPPDDEIATWSADDLGLVYEWAWSVVHLEADRPPAPGVLLRDDEPETVADSPLVDVVEGSSPDGPMAAVDGEPVGCTHEGRGLPDCLVCYPEGELGTGDPDGDLLP